MPVKVRCSGCQKVLNAPDAARGKAIRCPDCQTAVKVPAAGAAARKSAAPARKKPNSADAEGDFLAGIDLNRLEDQSRPVCQKCGADVYEEDIECPKCGVDLATGLLPEKTRKQRAQRGPDPKLYYKALWADSWNFLISHKILAVRTGLYWTLFLWLTCGTTFMVTWCERVPPKVFWGGASLMLALGAPGWGWYLLLRIVRETMANRDDYKRLNFDFFACLALGLKAVIWPLVLMAPVLPLLVIFALVSGATAALTGFQGPWLLINAAVYVLPYVVFPVAMVHMSMPHTYKAWLPWEMAKLVFKNFLPAAYWLIAAVAVLLPAWALYGYFGWNSVYFADLVLDRMTRLTVWILGLAGANTEPSGFVYSAVFAFNVSWSVLLIIIPFAFLNAFPAVFLMKATGLFGYYFRDPLELVNKTKEKVPAGFGPRYLALLVDTLILNIVGYVLYFGIMVASAIVIKMGIDYLVFVFMVLGSIAMFAFTVMYHVKSESGLGQATVGKRALGLIVTDLKGEKITPKMAGARYFGKIVSSIPLYAGFLMCLFNERKMTLHDQMTKTQVLWKGDDETDTAPE